MKLNVSFSFTDGQQGQQFALTEASYTTVRMCQAFSDIGSRDDQPWQELLALTCVNAHGAKVTLTPVTD